MQQKIVKRSKSLFYRTLLLIFVMALLMFVLAYAFLYSYVIRSYQSKTEDSARQLLHTSAEYVDLALIDIGRSMQQIMWNADIVGAILVPDAVSSTRKVEIVKVLQSFKNDYPLVSHVSLLTEKNGLLYAANGDIASVESTESQVFFRKRNPAVLEKDLQTPDGFSTTVLTVDGRIAVLQPFPMPEQNGLLLAEIDREILFRFLSASIDSEQMRFSVLSSDGTPLYAIGCAQEETGTTYRLQGNTDWSFCLSHHASYSNPSAREIAEPLLAWAAVFLPLSFVAAIFITKLIYRPIGQLRAAVETPESLVAGEHGNELTDVQHVYEHTRREKEDLSVEVLQMMPIVRERLYKNLLRGMDIPQDYLIDRLAYLKSPFHLDDYYAIVVAAENEPYAGNAEEVLTELYRSLSVANEQPRDGTDCQFLLMDDYVIVMILSFSKEQTTSALRRAQLELLSRVRALAKRYEESDALAFGCSRQARGITSLHYCYAEAEKDLDYRRYHGESESRASNPAFMEEAMEELLSHAQNAGTDRAMYQLDGILGEMRGQELTGLALSSGCDLLLNKMVESLLNLSVPEEKMQMFERYYHADPALSNDALLELVREIGQQAIGLLANYGQRNQNRYVSQAKKYIEQHCVDSRLSLDQVAAFLSINPAYLSRLFYELSDTNFVNYVNRCRVERAKQFLRQSKTPVQEVGFLCGFNSLQNFNRVFKRHTGATPGSYRKQQTGQEEKE